MTPPLPRDERILDLMTAEATDGLCDHDADRLEGYFSHHPEEDREGLMMASTAIALAALPATESAPMRLLEKLKNDASLRPWAGPAESVADDDIACIVPKLAQRTNVPATMRRIAHGGIASEKRDW